VVDQLPSIHKALSLKPRTEKKKKKKMISNFSSKPVQARKKTMDDIFKVMKEYKLQKEKKNCHLRFLYLLKVRMK
jgi:hypothetical protein